MTKKTMVLTLCSLVFLGTQAVAAEWTVRGAAVAAKSYFKWEPFREVTGGVFFKLGTPEDNVLLGSKTSLITHHEEDGHLLIPGITWNLVDLGWAIPVKLSDSVVTLGPSIKLNEPVKAGLRWGIKQAGLGGGFVDKLLAPGESAWALNIGPGWAIQASDHWKGVKGYPTFHAGLGARF